MTEEKNEPFNVKALKMALEKGIKARFAKYLSDQVRTSHQKGKTSTITQYINTQEIENILERIIIKLGGGALEQGMVFVLIKDKNGCIVTPDSNRDKIVVSVAFGHELIISNREYPPKGNGAKTSVSPPSPKETRSKIPASESPQSRAMPEKAPEPVVKSDDKPANKAILNDVDIRDKQIRLAKDLKRKLDELWANRKGLGVDFNNPGSLKIELVQDSPGITKLVKEIGEGNLYVSIDQESGLIKVYDGGEFHLDWEFPGEEI